MPPWIDLRSEGIEGKSTGALDVRARYRRSFEIRQHDAEEGMVKRETSKEKKAAAAKASAAKAAAASKSSAAAKASAAAEKVALKAAEKSIIAAAKALTDWTETITATKTVQAAITTAAAADLVTLATTATLTLSPSASTVPTTLVSTKTMTASANNVASVVPTTIISIQSLQASTVTQVSTAIQASTVTKMQTLLSTISVAPVTITVQAAGTSVASVSSVSFSTISTSISSTLAASASITGSAASASSSSAVAAAPVSTGSLAGAIGGAMAALWLGMFIIWRKFKRGRDAKPFQRPVLEPLDFQKSRSEKPAGVTKKAGDVPSVVPASMHPGGNHYVQGEAYDKTRFYSQDHHDLPVMVGQDQTASRQNLNEIHTPQPLPAFAPMPPVSFEQSSNDTGAQENRVFTPPPQWFESEERNGVQPQFAQFDQGATPYPTSPRNNDFYPDNQYAQPDHYVAYNTADSEGPRTPWFDDPSTATGPSEPYAPTNKVARPQNQRPPTEWFGEEDGRMPPPRALSPPGPATNDMYMDTRPPTVFFGDEGARDLSSFSDDTRGAANGGLRGYSPV